MNAFCPNCEKETKQRLINKIDQIEIRGESIPIHLEYYQCEECGEDYENPRPDYAPLEEAYREYRNRKGMTHPEEIKKFRKELGITQKEFSEILGIGVATLNRYENGALQSEAHDQAMRLCMQTGNLKQVLDKKPNLLSESARIRILQVLQNEEPEGGDLLEKAIENFGSYAPSILSGYQRFDVNKLFHMMKYFCYQDHVFKTKLLKLLFYADFKHFKENGVSISGVRYAHATHGPVPHKYDYWLAAILDLEKLFSSEEVVSGEIVGEAFTSGAPDWSVFSTSELAAISSVKNKFEKFSAKKIREYSHAEKGYTETKDGEIISYMYAADLQI